MTRMKKLHESSRGYLVLKKLRITGLNRLHVLITTERPQSQKDDSILTMLFVASLKA